MGRLTPLQIRNLKEPGRYSDGDGLYLEWTGPDKGNWQLRATVNGRRRDTGLGSMVLVSLQEARDVAFELRRDIQRGIDPVAQRKRRKLEILSFKAAALRVHAEQKASWKNGKHQDQWITTLESYAFPLLGNRLVNDIEGLLIREVLLPISDHRVRSLQTSATMNPWSGSDCSMGPYPSRGGYLLHKTDRLSKEFAIRTSSQAERVERRSGFLPIG